MIPVVNSSKICVKLLLSLAKIDTILREKLKHNNFNLSSDELPWRWLKSFLFSSSSLKQLAINNFYWANEYTCKVSTSRWFMNVKCLISLKMVSKPHGNAYDFLLKSRMFALPLFTQFRQNFTHNKSLIWNHYNAEYEHVAWNWRDCLMPIWCYCVVNFTD